MKRVVFIVLFFVFALQAKEIPLSSSKVCRKCHPLIYKEYKNSMHAKASIFKDPLHNALWQKHPDRKKGNYKCKKCHTPADTALKGLPQKNEVQLNEPISCVYCHRIESIEEHTKSNVNVLDKRGDTLFGARAAQKNQKGVEFGLKSSFFGLVKKEHGSPFHKIDFSNENFYNGKVCMGCHSHNQNGHGFNVCKTDEHMSEKRNCITCHMPKVQGSFSTIKHTKTHRFHGFAGVSVAEELLSEYVKMELKQGQNGYEVVVTNLAPHELLLHPMRLGELRIYVYTNGERTLVKKYAFFKVLGKEGKPSAPWEATQMLKNTQLQPERTKAFSLGESVKKGAQVEVVLGFYKVSPKIAKKFHITDKELLRFKVLKTLHKEL